MNKTKVILLTHTDLDGIGCAILARSCDTIELVDVIHTSYNNGDMLFNITKILDTIESDTELHITDISFRKDDPYIDMILDAVENKNHPLSKVILIDHHATSMWLNNYERAVKYTSKDESNLHISLSDDVCATRLYTFYIRRVLNKHHIMFDIFATIVNDYDLWYHKYGISKKLNTVLMNELNMYGRVDLTIDDIFENIHDVINEVFYDYYRIADIEQLIECMDRCIYELEPSLINIDKVEYMDKLKAIRIADLATQWKTSVLTYGYDTELNVAYIFNTDKALINELSEAIYNSDEYKNADLDAVAIINPNNGFISLRKSNDVKQDIHLGIIAEELFDGGGHASSAGGKITYIGNLL